MDIPFSTEPEFDDSRNRTHLANYQTRLYDRFSRTDMTGIMDAPEDVPFALHDVYIPLRVSDTEIRTIHKSEDVDEVNSLAFEDACRKHFSLLLSGAPGSGKSTLTQFLTMALSQPRHNETIGKLGRRLVMPITLRHLDFKKINNLKDLWREWLHLIKDRLDMELRWEFFEFYINHGWTVVIFDGVDELGELTNRTLITSISEWIKGHEKKREFNGNRIIVTGRPSGYFDNEDYSAFTRKQHLQPFNSQEILQYSKKWHSIRYHHDPAEAQRRQTAFDQALEKFSGLAELKHRPIYLAMLAQVAHADGQLPQTRTLAYQRMVEAYLYKLELLKQLKGREGLVVVPDWSPDDRWRFIEDLAFRIHSQAAEHSREYQDQLNIAVNHGDIRRLIREILTDTKNRFETIDTREERLEETTNQLLRYFLARSGLLIEPAPQTYQFSHLTFQEFLCAKRIFRRQTKRNLTQYLKQQLFDKLKHTGWLRVALEYFGIDTMQAGQEQSEILQELIEFSQAGHQRFLLDFLSTTDHTLTDREKGKWLKTLFAYWCMFRKSHFHWFNELAEMTQTGDDPFGMVSFLTKLLDDALLRQDTQWRCELLEPMNEDDAEFAMDKTITTIRQADIQAQRAFILISSASWDDIRRTFFLKTERIQALKKLGRDASSAVALEPYVITASLFNKAAPIADTAVSLLSVTEWTTLLFGYTRSLMHSRNSFQRQILYVHLISLMPPPHPSTLNIAAIETQLGSFFALVQALGQALDQAIEQVQDLDLTLPRDLEMALIPDLPQPPDQNGHLARAQARALAGDLTNDLILVKILVEALAGDLAQAGTGVLPRALARARDLADAMALCLDWALNLNMNLARAGDLAGNLARDCALAWDKASAWDRALAPNLLLTLYTFHFILFESSTRLAGKLEISIDISREKTEDLAKQIKTDESAIQYFEKQCGPIDDLRQRELKEWLNSNHSPRYRFDYILKYGPPSDFDRAKAIEQYHQMIKEFLKSTR